MNTAMAEPPELPVLPAGEGLPLPDDVRQAVVANLEAGLVSEAYQVEFIRCYLLTAEHREWLAGMRRDVADVLNGRFPAEETERVGQMLDAWNQRLGKRIYGFFY